MTTNKQQSEATLNEMLNSYGIENLSPRELRDFDLQGGETNAQLDEMARDYASDIASERAEHAAFKRCPQSVDPVNY